MKFERIELSGRYVVCGVLLWALNLFQRVGYFRPEEYDKSLGKRILYFLRMLAFISCQMLSLICVEIPAMIFYWPDLAKVSGAAFIFSANCCHAIKLCNVILNRDLFTSLIQFSYKSCAERDLSDRESLEIIVSNEKKSFRDILVVTVVSVMAVISLMCVGDRMDPSGLPLVAWYPFEIQYFPMFQVLYVHQMFAVMTGAFFNVTLDVFTTNVTIQLCCQFQLLKRDISLIRQIPRGEDEEIARGLSRLIDRHCVLKEQCADLGKAIGTIILGQFLGSIFIICITFYQFYRAADTTVFNLVAILITTGWALLQAFFYCFYGNEIKLESQSVAETLVDLPWYRYSERNKRTLIVMIHMAQRPIILQAAGLFNVTLSTLMSIIKTAYSVFSVMANNDPK